VSEPSDAMPPPVTQYQGYPYPYGYPRPRNTNGFAIAALVCSLAGVLVWFLGPVLGVVFGWVGLRQTSQSGESGRGLAIAAIVIGALMILLNIGFVVAIATSHSDTVSTGVSV
jgi:peptidyl-prolyl cis-trans isomerase B (cyclophilin B)